MRKLLSLVALSLVLGVATAQAQNNASITATATVQQPITVTGVNNLDFQAVFPGVNKTVAVGDATAGLFTVAGQASAPVSMTFVLPANLTFGANNLPIGTWTANHNTSAAPTGTSFTPSAAATLANLSATGNLYVYLGASVAPAINQVAGVYTGTVSLTVVY